MFPLTSAHGGAKSSDFIFCQENVMAGKVNKSLGGAEKVGVACLKFSHSQAGNFFTNGGVKLTTLIKYPGLGLSHLTLQ